MIQITGVDLRKNKLPDGSLSDFYAITFNDPEIRKSVKVSATKGHEVKGEVCYQVLLAKRSAIIDSLYKAHGKDWQSFYDKKITFTDAEMTLIKFM